MENICETINVKERRYSRPKFMKEIFNGVGFVDAGILMEEGSSPEEISYDKLNTIVENPDRNMPIIVIVKPDVIPDWAIDCDGYILRTDMLKKTLNGLCHVYLCSGDCKARYEAEYGKESVDGGVMMYLFLNLPMCSVGFPKSIMNLVSLILLKSFLLPCASYFLIKDICVE